MEKIETSRLIVRNFKLDDYEDVYEFLSQRKFDDFEAYPDITHENGVEHLRYRIDNDEFVTMELKTSGKVIGNVYLGNRDFNAKELGYIVNKNFQLQGYTSEAIKALIKNAFIQDTHRVFAECDPRNECSWKLLEKLGFKREAHLKSNIYFKKDAFGRPLWQDTFVYVLHNDK